MMNILEQLNHWTDQPENFVYIKLGIGLTIGLAIYVFTPIVTMYFTAGRLFDDVIVSGDQVIYRGTLSSGTGMVGRYSCNTKIAIVNAESGKTLKKRTLKDDEYKIHFIADGKIWTGSEKMEVAHVLREFRTMILDSGTLKTVYDNKGIQKHLNFKAGERVTSMGADYTSMAILFSSNAGTQYTFETSKITYVAPTNPSPSLSHYGSNKRREDFIRPIWINEFHKENVNGAVISRAQTMDASPYYSLSLVAEDGKLIWTTTQQSMGIDQITEGGRLEFEYCGACKNRLIYRANSSRKIVALNTTNGKVMWTRRFL